MSELMEMKSLSQKFSLVPALLAIQIAGAILAPYADAKLPPVFNNLSPGPDPNMQDDMSGAKSLTRAVANLFAVRATTAEKMKAMTSVSYLTERISRMQDHALVLPESEMNKLAPGKRDLLQRTIAASQARRLASLLNQRGTNLALIGDRDKAMSDLDEAVVSDQSYAPAFNNRAWMKAQAGDLDGAMNDVNKAIELMPDMAQAFDTRGTIYLARQKYDLALTDFNTSIERDPSYAEAYYHRAILHKTLGEPKEFESDTQKAIERGYPIDEKPVEEKSGTQQSKG